MTKNVYDERGETLIRQEEAEPVCGVHFCDRCGDCLGCYGGDPCIDSGPHFWVKYGDI